MGFYNQGLTNRAIPRFEAVRNVDEQHGTVDEAKVEQVLFLLGECYYVDREFEKAAVRYLELVRRFDETRYRADALLRSGESLVKIDRNEQAITVLETLREAPGKLEPEALYWLGEAQSRAGQNDAAIQTLDTYLEKFSAHKLVAFARFNLAGLLHHAERHQEALGVLDRLGSGQVDEAIKEPWGILAGDLALATDDPERAIREYGRIAAPERRAIALEGVCRAARKLGKRDVFVTAHDELVDDFAATEQRVASDLLLGAWVAEVGDVAEADRWLEPQRDGVHRAEADFWRAWARGVAGRHDEAADLYRDIAKGDGEWAIWGGYRLVAELRSLAQWPEALASALEFVRAHPDDARVPEVLAGAVESAYNVGDDSQTLALREQFASKYAAHELSLDVDRFACEAALRQQNWPLAISGFESLIARSKSAELRRETLPRLAWCYYQRDPKAAGDEIANALAELQRVDAAQPERVADVALLLGHSRRLAGEAEAALAAFELASQSAPDSDAGIKASLELAALGSRQSGQDYDGSVARYHRVLERASGETRARALLELAELETAAGKFEAARPHFTSYIEEFPAAADLGFAQLGLAFCQWRGESPQQAAETLDRVHLDDAKPDPRLESEYLFLRGQVSVELDDTAAATEAFERYLERHGGGAREPEVLRELARVCEQTDEPDRAMELLDKLCHDYPERDGFDEALYRLAWLRQEHGDTDSAAELYRRLLAHDGKSPFAGDAHYGLADIAYGAGQLADAREHYEAAIASSEAERLAPFARYRIAWSHQKEENWSAAFASFSEVVDKHADSELAAESMFLAAEAARRIGDVNGERKQLERFVSDVEKHQYTKEAKIRLCELLTAEEAWERTRSLLTPLLDGDLNPDLTCRHRVCLGRALTHLGAAQTAIGYFEAALTDGKGVAAEAQFEMGNAYRELGDRKRAIEVFLSGPILYPFKPWAVRSYLEAGRDTLAEGNEREAKRILSLAVKEDSGGTWGKQAQALLDTMN